MVVHIDGIVCRFTSWALLKDRICRSLQTRLFIGVWFEAVEVGIEFGLFRRCVIRSGDAEKEFTAFHIIYGT
jgi:hypothetical protein